MASGSGLFFLRKDFLFLTQTKKLLLFLVPLWLAGPPLPSARPFHHTPDPVATVRTVPRTPGWWAASQLIPSPFFLPFGLLACLLYLLALLDLFLYILSSLILFSLLDILLLFVFLFVCISSFSSSSPIYVHLSAQAASFDGPNLLSDSS